LAVQTGMKTVAGLALLLLGLSVGFIAGASLAVRAAGGPAVGWLDVAAWTYAAGGLGGLAALVLALASTGESK
jgi:hypothetical protein